MTSTITHIQTAYDRADPVERLLRWWLTSLRSLSPSPDQEIHADQLDEERMPRTVRIVIPACHGFLSDFSLPPASVRNHIAAVTLRLTSTLPVDPDTVRCAMAAKGPERDGSIPCRLVALRHDDIEHWEKVAKARGARRVQFCLEDEMDIAIISRSEAEKQRFRQIRSAILALGILVAGWLAVSQWTDALDRSVAAKVRMEQTLRVQALRLERELAETRRINSIASDHVVHADIPAMRQDLDALSAMMPTGLRVTSIHWRPRELEIQTQGNTATAEPWRNTMGSWQIVRPETGGDADSSIGTFNWRRNHEERLDGSE